MPEFNLAEAQQFQSQVLERIREIERELDKEVLEYYTNDRVDDETDYYQNLRGLHSYLKQAYQNFGQLLSEIERRVTIL